MMLPANSSPGTGDEINRRSISPQHFRSATSSLLPQVHMTVSRGTLRSRNEGAALPKSCGWWAIAFDQTTITNMSALSALDGVCPAGLYVSATHEIAPMPDNILSPKRIAAAA